MEINFFFDELHSGIKHPHIKLQHLEKVRIWAFGLLVLKSITYKGFLKELRNRILRTVRDGHCFV